MCPRATGVLRNRESNLNNSFSIGIANPDWLVDSGISRASNPDPMNPLNHGYVGVDSSFTRNYDNALTSLLGMVSLGDAINNYNRQGAALAHAME